MYMLMSYKLAPKHLMTHCLPRMKNTFRTALCPLIAQARPRYIVRPVTGTFVDEYKLVRKVERAMCWAEIFPLELVAFNCDLCQLLRY